MPRQYRNVISGIAGGMLTQAKCNQQRQTSKLLQMGADCRASRPVGSLSGLSRKRLVGEVAARVSEHAVNYGCFTRRLIDDEVGVGRRRCVEELQNRAGLT